MTSDRIPAGPLFMVPFHFCLYSFSVQKSGYVRKGFQTAPQDPMYICNGDPIIGHGYALIPGAFHPVLHLPLIEHASAAVDDQTVAAQVVRKFRS